MSLSGLSIDLIAGILFLQESTFRNINMIHESVLSVSHILYILMLPLKLPQNRRIFHSSESKSK